MHEIRKLVPLDEAQSLDGETWDINTSDEHKWELWEGIAFGPDGIERDRLAVCLVYNMGLRHFLEILPAESKGILKELLGADHTGGV
ncbi:MULTISPECIES: hypothetical protein [unclassified Paenibacillus]|uniref:hypothetical protein n=1 Tax=unclassified Paenibacillus TaxID=185978 RepID=UPI001AE7FC65|nr:MULTISPECIES: hypothetical protein [unclassified Paenibacillus]MBP1153934.1 hypothetical protein [Paenibacillus sp. PvP091]MBP1170681.1 hypothetical protein [Paenibacillus sp. PvR098]MBP2441709.1 hypothetical protein [Paenibacillus sp. PvP052]